MKNLILIFFCILSANCQPPKKTINKKQVLFVGNSLTFYHDMPQMVQNMLDEDQLEFEIDQITFPGLFLGWHLDKTIMENDGETTKVRAKEVGEVTETEIKIREKEWNFIVLQEGTLRVLIPESRELIVSDAIEKFRKKINNPNCKIILFNTWASKTTYPKEFCYPGVLIHESLQKNQKYCSETVNNLKEHTNLVHNSYLKLAKKHKIETTNNSLLFYEIRTEHPEIELFDDNFHPSKYGSFLNACEFYRVFSGKNPSELKYTGGLDYERANIIKNVVSK